MGPPGSRGRTVDRTIPQIRKATATDENPMAKFVLIDHSLDKPGGYHYKDALHLLRAAACRTLFRQVPLVSGDQVLGPWRPSSRR
jgi:hypothetical protein